MALDISYFEQGYIDETYFVRTADAVSTEPITATMTASCGVIRGTAVSMTARFTQSANVVEQRLAQLFAFTNAQLTAFASRIRNYNVSISSSTVLAVQGTRLVYVMAEEGAEFTMATVNRRVRTSTAAPVAAFSLPTVPGSIVVASTKATPRTTATIIGNLNG
jgi:hypothetical protein